jgi:hypothetical protein
MAAGLAPDGAGREPVTTLIVDIAEIWGTGEPKLWTETIAERLNKLDPSRYENWTAEHVTRHLNTIIADLANTAPDAELPVNLVRGVKIDGVNRQGIHRDDFNTLYTTYNTHTDRPLFDENGGRSGADE